MRFQLPDFFRRANYHVVSRLLPLTFKQDSVLTGGNVRSFEWKPFFGREFPVISSNQGWRGLGLGLQRGEYIT